MEELARKIKGFELVAGDEVEGRYKIIGQIGVGGMGSVYKAEHVVLGKTIALKILSNELVDDKTMMSRFEQEAKACASLSHPNLVSVYDCGSTSRGEPYLIMEFLQGVDLFQTIKAEKKIEVDRFLNIFIQVASGLAHAHDAGVIHRDLKPSNIILTEGAEGKEQPKVVDFGVAKIEELLGGEIQVLTQTGEVLGSPSYMSPEQCRGGSIDVQSDIYSLGCVMYEALTGKQAFPGASMITIMTMQLEDDAKPITSLDEKIPADLNTVIMKCLEKEPEDRYQSMLELREELQALKEGLVASRTIEVGGMRISAEVVTTVLVLVAIIVSIASFSFMLPGGSFFDFTNKLSKNNQATSGSKLSIAERALLAAYYDRVDFELSADKKYHEMLDAKDLELGEYFGAAAVLLERLNDHEQFDDAIKLYNQKLLPKKKEVLESSNSNQNAGIASTAPVCLYFSARAYDYKKQKKKARSLYFRALSLSNTLNSPEWVKARLNQEYAESLLEDKPRDYKKAIEYFKIAGDHFAKQKTIEEFDLSKDRGNISRDLFKCYKAIGKNSEAEAALEDGIELLMKNPKRKKQAGELISLLIAHHDENNEQEQVARWRTILAKSTGSKSSATDKSTSLEKASLLVLMDRGLYLEREELFSLQDAYEEALKKAQSKKGSALEQCAIAAKLMRVYSISKNKREADSLFAKVSPALSRIKERMLKEKKRGKTFSYTGSAPLVYYYAAESKLYAGQYKASISRIQQGLQLTEQQPDGVWAEGKLMQLTGRVYLAMNQLEEAEASLSESVTLMKSVTKHSNFHTAESMRYLSKVYVRQKEYEKAKIVLRKGMYEMKNIPWMKERINVYKQEMAKLNKITGKDNTKLKID